MANKKLKPSESEYRKALDVLRPVFQKYDSGETSGDPAADAMLTICRYSLGMEQSYADPRFAKELYDLLERHPDWNFVMRLVPEIWGVSIKLFKYDFPCAYAERFVSVRRFMQGTYPYFSYEILELEKDLLRHLEWDRQARRVIFEAWSTNHNDDPVRGR